MEAGGRGDVSWKGIAPRPCVAGPNHLTWGTRDEFLGLWKWVGGHRPCCGHLLASGELVPARGF